MEALARYMESRHRKVQDTRAVKELIHLVDDVGYLFAHNRVCVDQTKTSGLSRETNLRDYFAWGRMRKSSIRPGSEMVEVFDKGSTGTPSRGKMDYFPLSCNSSRTSSYNTGPNFFDV